MELQLRQNACQQTFVSGHRPYQKLGTRREELFAGTGYVTENVCIEELSCRHETRRGHGVLEKIYDWNKDQRRIFVFNEWLDRSLMV